MEIFSADYLNLLGIVALGGAVLGPLLMHAWPQHFDPRYKPQRIQKRK